MNATAKAQGIAPIKYDEARSNATRNYRPVTIEKKVAGEFLEAM